METTIKETVKNIFKSNTFESALELTKEYRGEYIREFGVKSWNGLVTYYSKADIKPAAVVAEADDEYPADSGVEEDGEDVIEAQENVDDYPIEEIDEEVADENESGEDAQRVEYMLYRNTGEEVSWFGHRENFYGLAVGDTARLIRMNNKGVSEGVVVATKVMSLDDIALFHRCYAVIIRMKRSYKEQLDLAAKCLMNLPAAIAGAYDRVPKSDTKLTDYVLNFQK